jgi:hypothetical protein
MSEPKFTEGPWDVEEELYDHDWAISAPKWGALARVVAEMDDDGGGKTFTISEQGKANADLIAAAPELYGIVRKAIQLATIAIDWNLDEVEIDGEMVNTYRLREEFEKAFKKAAGK